MKMPLRIGFTACFFHADPQRPIFKGKTLLYMEESMSRWMMDAGAVPWLMPRVSGAVSPEHVLDGLDGLLLQGGSDVCPETYGETARKPAWNGDRERDLYEIALVKAAMHRGMPILGVCRGQQLLNVALGGTLHQDITEDIPDALQHRNWDIYDDNAHRVDIASGSRLEKVLGASHGTVNSIHHQSVKTPGEGLVVEARCTHTPAVIEAIRYTGDSYASAVQWHPEFRQERHATHLPADPIRDDFLAACQAYALGG